MEFVAIDVETANADLASICQVGIAKFENGRHVESWESIVNPRDHFDPMNVRVHGIDEDRVDGAPDFPAILDTIVGYVSGTVVVCHTTFDQSAIRASCARYSLQVPEITWLDSARVVRRTWSDLARRGYGLAPVAKRLGIEFQHHNAAEDARAAGEILVHAICESKISVEEWVVEAKLPITVGQVDRGGRRAASEVVSDGPLGGEVAVFTGALSIPRREAADLAATAGCEVSSSVSKKTTLLVVGDQDIRLLAGHEKSSKHRKAEALINNGQNIRVLRETDFRTIIEQAIE